MYVYIYTKIVQRIYDRNLCSLFKVEIHATFPSGHWFAVGFSDRGERNNADWCVYVADRTGWARIIVSNSVINFRLYAYLKVITFVKVNTP